MRPAQDTVAEPNVHISGHQVELSDALKEHVRTHLLGVAEKYLGAEDAAVTFSRSGSGFGCTVRVHAGHAVYCDGQAENHDAYAAFNAALERVAKQLRRRKRELREDKPVNPDKQGVLGP